MTNFECEIVVYFVGDMPFISINRELYNNLFRSINVFKNHLKDILKDVNKIIVFILQFKVERVLSSHLYKTVSVRKTTSSFGTLVRVCVRVFVRWTLGF